MDEDVLAAVVRLNEPVTLRRIKPLHCPHSHVTSPFPKAKNNTETQTKARLVLAALRPRAPQSLLAVTADEDCLAFVDGVLGVVNTWSKPLLGVIEQRTGATAARGLKHVSKRKPTRHCETHYKSDIGKSHAHWNLPRKKLRRNGRLSDARIYDEPKGSPCRKGGFLSDRPLLELDLC